MKTPTVVVVVVTVAALASACTSPLSPSLQNSPMCASTGPAHSIVLTGAPAPCVADPVQLKGGHVR